VPGVGVAGLFLMHEDAAVAELQHDAEVDAGLIHERCPCLGKGGADQKAEDGRGKSKVTKQFQAGSPKDFLKQPHLLYLYFQCLGRVKRFVPEVQQRGLIVAGKTG